MEAHDDRNDAVEEQDDRDDGFGATERYGLEWNGYRWTKLNGNEAPGQDATEGQDDVVGQEDAVGQDVVVGQEEAVEQEVDAGQGNSYRQNDNDDALIESVGETAIEAPGETAMESAGEDEEVSIESENGDDSADFDLPIQSPT